MKEWIKENGGFVLPVYSTDIFYNMLKRIAREQGQKAAAPIAKEDLFTNLQLFLEYIRSHLVKADEIYGDGYFTNIWDTCPVIEILKKGEDGVNSVKGTYNRLVEKMLFSDDNLLKERISHKLVVQYMD